MSLRNLLREPLRNFKPYIVGKPIDEVRREHKLAGRIAKLASNENPLGTSPLALEAMRNALADVSLYPDDNAYYFRRKVAERYDVEIGNVFAASGSVEVIELAAQAFLDPGDVVVSSERSFAMYALVAAKAGALFRAAPMTDGGYRYDLPAIAHLVDPLTKIVFLANPTNPTGTWFTRPEFDRFMEAVPPDVLVVYDSAYEEYTTVPDMPAPMAHFRAGRRLLFLRTFSKASGLAGVRIGFAIGPPDIVHGLMTCRVPFNANLVAQAGAMAAMDDQEFVLRSREHNQVELEFLRRGLEGLPVTIPPTQTNFLYVDMPVSADWIFEELQKVGVIVRPVGPKAIRVSCGLREDDRKFLDHFRRLVLSSGTAG
jgi:histidinol-phosphate aminotransferase